MSNTMYLHNLSESVLAKYQQAQTGNSCAICAACAALNLLFDTHLIALDWIKLVDQHSFPEILKIRMLRNGPTTPMQQVNLIRWIARESSLSVSVQRKSLTLAELSSIQLRARQVTLITLGWLFAIPPEISLGHSNANYNSPKFGSGYHTMLFAGFDPNHICLDGIIRPWGFVNSWIDGGEQLFWMQDNPFQYAWNTWTPLGGIRSAVVVTSQ